jgi:hypothetical protein
MRRRRRKVKFDYGDMFTKPASSGGIDTSALTQMNVNTPAGLQQGASPYYTPSNLNTIAKPPAPRMSADQKGSLIGAAGQLVGSAVESKQQFKETEFTEDLQKSRKEAKAALYGIGTAAAAVNPIVGGAIIAGTAIGSAIGSQTQGEWGQYKSRSGNAIDEMVNPVTGYQGIKRALQGKQTASGALNKLTLGLFGKSDNQKDAEKGKRAYEAKRIRTIKENSQQKLANYNTSGISDYNTMLAMGGFLPKYTKRGKRRYAQGDLIGKPEPRTSTDPLEDEELGDPNKANSPYYSPENLNAIVEAVKPQPQANPPPGQQPPKQSWFNTPKGQAAGGAAMAASNLLPQYNNPNQTAGEKATDQAGVQIAGAIGPWWGALAKVGTTASGHIRQDDTGSHARGFIGDTVNPFHQFNSLQEGKGKEQTAAFLNPVMASHLAADRRKQAALSKKRLEMVERQKVGQQKLANYNVNGNIYAKYGTQFPMGGDLPTPTDQGQGEQLASNMAQYHGPTHANGGIELDTDQNADADIEVEGTEVIKDNMVFSNRLRPSKDVKNIVRDSGVGTRKGDTYATLSARIGKKKGKFEEQMNSTRAGEKNSAQIMQGRLDETANLLFMDQQARKFKKGTNGKYPFGGKIDPDPKKKKKIDPYDTRLELLVDKEDLKKAANTPMSPLNKYDSAYRGLAPVVPPTKKKFPNGGNVPPKRKGTGFTAPVGNKDAFKRDALGKNRAELEKDKSLQTLDIGRVDFEDWNQRGADNPDNPLNDPKLLSVDRSQILDRFRANNKLFATTFARYDPGNSPEQQKLKGSWMDNDIYMDAPPKPLPEVADTPPPSPSKLNPTYVAPQLYQYGSWKKPKKPYGGYTAPGSEILPPRRRGRMVQATNVTPPPVFPPAVNAPVIPVNPAGKYPYSTPGQAPPPFSFEDETRRLEALRQTPTFKDGGETDPPKKKFSVATAGTGASNQSNLPPTWTPTFNVPELYESTKDAPWWEAGPMNRNAIVARRIQQQAELNPNSPELKAALPKADSTLKAEDQWWKDFKVMYQAEKDYEAKKNVPKKEPKKIEGAYVGPYTPGYKKAFGGKFPGGGLIGPVQEPLVDPRTLYGKYDPAISPQSQIPLVRSNRRKAIGMQTAILDNKMDLATMHPDTRFVTDSTANASQNFLMKHDPAYVDAMKDVKRGPLLPIQAYGGYTKRLHKMNDALKTRAFGGYLPAFAIGGVDDEEDPYQSRKSVWGTTAPPVYADLSTRTTPYAITPTKANLNPSTAPLKVLPPVKTPVGLTGGMQGLLDARGQRIAEKAGKKKIGTRGFDVSDYKGDIAAGLGTIANQIMINKLETKFDPETITPPRNPYTDRRDALTHQANEQYRTATQGIEGSDAQGNLALRSNMYAKSLGNLNQQLDQEQQREDAMSGRHAELKNRTDTYNTQFKNQAKMLSMENRNQKRALTQANIDNLIKSYQGNETVRSFTKTEQGKNLLAALQSGDRGTSERLLESLSPEMRKQIGLKYEANGGVFKKGGIYIKPKNRGKFNALKKRTGKTTEQLKHSKNPLTRKRATFAANAKKWKH